jgi:hypothetical protein
MKQAGRQKKKTMPTVFAEIKCKNGELFFCRLFSGKTASEIRDMDSRDLLSFSLACARVFICGLAGLYTPAHLSLTNNRK